ncbi:hypothetical protein ACP70R_024870 [Stipagrostis hirtigluma subsp. patula]
MAQGNGDFVRQEFGRKITTFGKLSKNGATAPANASDG